MEGGLSTSQRGQEGVIDPQRAGASQKLGLFYDFRTCWPYQQRLDRRKRAL